MAAALAWMAAWSPAHAGPDIPRERIRRAFQLPPVPFEGELSFQAAGEKVSLFMISSGPRGVYRRDLMGPEGAARSVVGDGEREWIFDGTRRRVWIGTHQPAIVPAAALFQPQTSDQLSLSTGSPVAGRPSSLIEVRSREGQLRQRIWIDEEHGVALRGEAFAPDGGLGWSWRFKRVSFGRRRAAESFEFRPSSAAIVSDRLQADDSQQRQAVERTGLQPRKPKWLPSGYYLESVGVMAHGRKSIIHYRFSDGATMLSLFQCPPRVRLKFGPKGGRRLRLSNGSATLSWSESGPVLGWSDLGFKFVLVGRLDAEGLRRVAESVQ
ncbi:MAG: hypothetical protein HY549_03905 [Elusimicrobia bacterium]|nr:hypothetical protein [Elusimicrobiota bacterium]